MCIILHVKLPSNLHKSCKNLVGACQDSCMIYTSVVLASILHGPCKILHVHRTKFSISYLHTSCKNLVGVCQDACKITAWFLHVSYVDLVRIIQGSWQETCQAFGQNLVSFSCKIHECVLSRSLPDAAKRDVETRHARDRMPCTTPIAIDRASLGHLMMAANPKKEG